MLNARADDSRIVDSPRAAASVRSRPPSAALNAEVRPARRPWSMPRAVMYRTSGPGIATSTRAASMKTPIRSGIPPPYVSRNRTGNSESRHGDARAGQRTLTVLLLDDRIRGDVLAQDRHSLFGALHLSTLRSV